MATFDAPPGTPDAAAVDGSTSLGWRTLVTSPWTLAAAPSEGYRCARRTIPVDTYVRAFRPMAPLGTHHTVLSIDSGSQPDGDTDCGPIAGYRVIYASGINSSQFDLPAGTAMRIRAGNQIVLNLHLYNTDPDHTLSGVSGVEIEAVDPGTIQHEAEAILAGPLAFTIDPGTQARTFTCTLFQQATLFAIAPHMHRLGIHQKVVTGTGSILLDQEFSFENQAFYAVGPTTLPAGSQLNVTCTWDNDTGGPIGWGDSSDAEMCFAITYLYPVGAALSICTN